MVGPSPSQRRRWSNLVPIFVALVVIAEIAFLGRLDLAEQAAVVQHYWSSSFYFPSAAAASNASATPWLVAPLEDDDEDGSDVDFRKCEDWLEREDAVPYARDFVEHPVIVSGVDQNAGWCLAPCLFAGNGLGNLGKNESFPLLINLLRKLGLHLPFSGKSKRQQMPQQVLHAYQFVPGFSKPFPESKQADWSSCSVGCKFGDASDRLPDASFGLPQDTKVASVLRSMESSHYYAENSLDLARRRGYKIIMTTSLSSDVPVGYFSWSEYDIMAPLHPKTEEALAAAFISNCGARNFRLQALEMLEKLDIKIDSYGSCHRNRDGRVDKIEALRRYKFSLAFENSNEEDYVTEKFFQSLVAGTVPIVVGAPNIQDFAPSPGSVLHIKELKDVASVAKTMRYLAANPDAYNQSVRWKYEGPSDSFKALVDMAAVHSSCRLCIHIATKVQEKEEKSPRFQGRPCKCTVGAETVYHLYVRERGRFKTESIYMRSSRLTLEDLKSAVLEKFKSLNHIPVWKKERPEIIRGGDDFKVHTIYPVGLTQRQALFTFRFNGDTDLKRYIESNPCTKLEVIFV